MYEHLHQSPQEFQLSDNAASRPSIHEDGISNRQRQSLRRKSASLRRQEARTAQDKFGMRFRIWRKVLNEEDFASQFRVWHKPHQDHTARRKSYRTLTMTVFDSGQQPLRNPEPYTQEELTETLQRKHPGLFEQLAPIAVAGAMRLGSQREPFIALVFSSPELTAEQHAVGYTIAPELWIDDSHQLIHRPHVSLGKILVADATERARVAGQIEAQLEPVLPQHVVLGPANVDVLPINPR